MREALTSKPKKFDWNEYYDNLRQTYYVFQKILHEKVTLKTPCMKIQGFIECIKKDPEYKKKDDK